MFKSTTFASLSFFKTCKLSIHVRLLLLITLTDSWLWWVSAIAIILTPQALSDVAATDADREGHEGYHKTKFISDILKENGKTKLVGKDRMWYHKTLITDILEESEKTNLVGDGCNRYHKTKLIAGIHKAVSDERWGRGRTRSHRDDDDDCDDPCIYFGQVLGDCLRSNGESDDEVDDCADCIDGAMASYNGTICGELEEVGFCQDVQSCADDACHNDCSDEMHVYVACYVNWSCKGPAYNDECISGI